MKKFLGATWHPGLIWNRKKETALVEKLVKSK
jgi:hypothetical protein